ncbi:MAG: DUF4886 domain-containing protein [Oscillospiraceae bacterium]|nr:DUF4886 domain-containing protein [Oscillospiraceae bacterium]
MNGKIPERLNVLFVGNSFSLNTSRFLPKIAFDRGVKEVKIGVLYVGGCSIKSHYEFAMEDKKIYEYFVSTDGTWEYEQEGWKDGMGKRASSREALEEGPWDYVVIQNYHNGGSRHVKPEAYEKLSPLIQYIKDIVGNEPKIVFNVPWIESRTDGNYPDLYEQGGHRMILFARIMETMRDVVLAKNPVDMISPTGTAVQNARFNGMGEMSADGCHINIPRGHLVVALAFFKALTGVDIDGLEWLPDEVTEEEKQLAIQSANDAIKTPNYVTMH